MRERKRVCGLEESFSQAIRGEACCYMEQLTMMMITVKGSLLPAAVVTQVSVRLCVHSREKPNSSNFTHGRERGGGIHKAVI